MKQKIKTIKELAEIIEKEKFDGKIIVTTNGSFDIVHLAHLRFLEKAKSFGDILIVLLNSDISVRRNKGDKRPIISEQERAEFLTYLTPVDYVTIFREDKPLELLSYLKPSIHVKGGSYIPERIQEEKGLVESYGGVFRTIGLETEYSTTNLIKKILEIHKDEII